MMTSGKLALWILDQERKPVRPSSLIEWAKFMQASQENRMIGYEEIEPGLWISTVFLGIVPIDFEFGLFQTMQFNEQSGKGRIIGHYDTWEEAAVGHAAAVAQARGGMDNQQGAFSA